VLASRPVNAPLPEPRPASTLRFPPPREAWERPTPAGWISSLHLWALRLLELLASVGAALLSTRLAAFAWAMTDRPLEGARFAGWFLVCCLAALLAAAPVAWLVRRLGGIALLAEMFADTDRLARVQGRPPVWPDEPPADGEALRLAHLSDLHLAEGEDVRLVEAERPAGNRAFARLLETPEIAESEVLLATGDITDRGTAASWQLFFEALDKHGLAERTLLVPGNHDVMLVQALEPGRVMERALSVDRFAVTQLANLYKFADAFAKTLGGRHGIVARDAALGIPEGAGGWAAADKRSVVTFAEAWRHIQAKVKPLLDALPAESVPALRPLHLVSDWRKLKAHAARIDDARARLLALFPVAVPLPSKDAVIFVLNSCTLVSRHPAFNAFGMVGKAQHLRLEQLARCFPQRLRLVALHHHIVRRGEELATDLRDRLFARFGLLGDWWRLVRFCREQGVRAVLNGHRHLSYALRLPNGTLLLAAPSSTGGDELSRDARPQFEVFRFPIEPLPIKAVSAHHSVVRLPAPAEAPPAEKVA
jgi:hypothetical protein